MAGQPGGDRHAAPRVRRRAAQARPAPRPGPAAAAPTNFKINMKKGPRNPISVYEGPTQPCLTFCAPAATATGLRRLPGAPAAVIPAAS